jgi:hypothetical protein
MKSEEEITKQIECINILLLDMPMCILDFYLEIREGFIFALNNYDEKKIKDELYNKEKDKLKFYVSTLFWILSNNKKEYVEFLKKFREPEWSHEKSLDMLFGRYQTQKECAFYAPKEWKNCPRCNRKILKFVGKMALCPICFEVIK